MSWLESRLQSAEARIEKIYRDLLALQQAVKAAAQTATAAFQQYPDGGTGAGQPYFFGPTGGLAAASGVPASGTPTSLSDQSLYVISGGDFVLATNTATVYNGMTSALVATNTAIALANADGTFSAITQACDS